MKRDPNNVGKKLVALDVRAGLSPMVEAVVPASASARQIVEAISRDLVAVFERHLPGCQWSMEAISVALHGRSGYILPIEEQKRRWKLNEDSIAAMFQAADALRELEHQEDPHNGTLGWWSVSGVRHSAIVRAASAPQAIEKAAEHVQDWESPCADWIGETLPDVFSV